jgi:Uma2 family endonuclease
MAGGNVPGSSSGSLDWSEPGSTEPESMKRATYEDVLNAPENKVAEILDGELFLSPRPAPRHSVAATRLSSVVANTFDDGVRGPGGPGGWWILAEPELHFAEHVVVPDIAGWRRERLSIIPDEAYFALAPDWICEVLSPSTERIDRGRKLRIYAEAGVSHAWFVKPTDRSLEVMRLREGAWTIVGSWQDAASVRVEPFEAIAIELARLWVNPAPTGAP